MKQYVENINLEHKSSLSQSGSICEITPCLGIECWQALATCLSSSPDTLQGEALFRLAIQWTSLA